MFLRNCWAALFTLALLSISNAQSTLPLPGEIVSQPLGKSVEVPSPLSLPPVKSVEVPSPMPIPPFKGVEVPPLPMPPVPSVKDMPALPVPNPVTVPTLPTPSTTTTVPPPLEAGTFSRILTDPTSRTMPKVEPPQPTPLASVWDNGLNFLSEASDWKIHLGGRLQFEPIFWAQPKNMKGPPPGNGGIPASTPGDGIGSLDDGMFFRRVRLRADGIGYGSFEFMFEVNFEQLNYITYDHMWAGVKDIPFLGTVRIGQHKVPQGLEMMGSDYHLTFIERSSLSDAYWTLFAPGIFVANDFLDKRLTAQAMIHRIQPVGFYTSDFGDGDYAATGRMTWTPLYADEGAHVVHVGASYQWRHGDLGRTTQPGATGNAYADTQSVARFRARSELRDANGIGVTTGGDVGRMVDTGFVLTDYVQTVSPEFLWIFGPLSIQAEGAGVFAHNVRSVYPAADFNRPRGNAIFWGGYVQASYFLTGEHRGYDRRFGTFDRPTVANRFGPLVKGMEGFDPSCWNWGAWEVGYRYSYLDVNDAGVNGGQMGQHTLGLNWYLNDNFKLQFNYLNIQRDVVGPAVSGTIHGFGLMTQWYF